MFLFFKLYTVVLLALLALDGLWIGLVAKSFYKAQLGHLLSDHVQWVAAILFYAIYAAGLVVFVINPAIGKSLVTVFFTGALLGLMAYGAYDFTNQATIRDWPLMVTIVDLCWGTFMTGIVSVVGVWTARFFV